MSHVDEGTLHAYLDGALDALPGAEAKRVREHLAACEPCRTRLEEERAVREHASAILSGVTLDVGALPPLDELRARARRRGSPGLRLQRFSWAASVILALGTGWMLRGGGVAVPQQEAASLRAVEPEAKEKVTDVPDLAVGAVSAAGRADEVTGGVLEGAGRIQGVAQEKRAESERDAVASDDRQRAAVPTTPAELWAAARGNREATPAPSSLPTVAPAADQAPARRLEAVPARQAAFEDARLPMVEESGVAALSEVLHETLMVPGLAVVSVTRLADAGLAGAVRVVQLLEDGDTLQVVHLPAGVDPSVLSSDGDGRTQVVARRGAGWLVLRAWASTDTLAALLRRLEGGQ